MNIYCYFFGCFHDKDIGYFLCMVGCVLMLAFVGVYIAKDIVTLTTILNLFQLAGYQNKLTLYILYKSIVSIHLFLCGILYDITTIYQKKFTYDGFKNSWISFRYQLVFSYIRCSGLRMMFANFPFALNKNLQFFVTASVTLNPKIMSLISKILQK